MKKLNNSLYLLLLFLGISSCKSVDDAPLPVLGRIDIVDGDTILHTIPDWSFVNQDSLVFTNKSLAPYIYVADFFFTSCPSICPKVMKQMLRVYDEFEHEPLLKLVSFTMDPKRDDVAKLKLYSTNLGVNTEKWHFLTGNKEELLDLADDYFIVAYEDADAPGGFDHSGKLILTDTDGHVRAFCEGTDPEDVTQFIVDVKKLLKSYSH